MLRKASYVTIIALPVAVVGVLALKHHLPIGPIVLALGFFPIAGLLMAKRSLVSALPDMVFGAIDTGLLTIPAIWGGVLFGVAGAIAGGVIGDALTGAIGGFFEGSISEWLGKGIDNSMRDDRPAPSRYSGILSR